MGSVFGKLFQVSSFGESHGTGMGVVVDGCPAGLPLSTALIQKQLDRRRGGQSAYSTARAEPDVVRMLSGVWQGKTIGTPIAMLIDNQDARPQDYQTMGAGMRPSHADHSVWQKFGIPRLPGGGRSSARETVARVAAGAVAKQLLAVCSGCDIVGFVSQVHTIVGCFDIEQVDPHLVEASPIRCPDVQLSEAMQQRIAEAKAAGDSVGGVITVVAKAPPPGLGEPVFDKLDADLAKAMLSIPACKAVEIGDGFASTTRLGSENNDLLQADAQGRIGTRTNRAGGIVGGIGNGATIWLRVAFKPTATIAKPQASVDHAGKSQTIVGSGRHDPCVLPRAVPIVEAMMALTLADHWLRHRARYRMV